MIEVEAINASGKFRLCDNENVSTRLTANAEIGEEIGKRVKLSISFLINFNSVLLRAP